MTNLRIGHGYDIHRLIEGPKLIIGGVDIPFDKGIEAHSDGDVLLHALCDAMLGAAACGDIGQHFPDSDDRYANANSRDLLRYVYKLLQQKNYKVGNIDSTIIAQKPKMSPHLETMKANIGHDLCLKNDQVNIKATTMEKLGPIGREEALAAHCVVLISSNK